MLKIQGTFVKNQATASVKKPTFVKNQASASARTPTTNAKTPTHVGVKAKEAPDLETMPEEINRVLNENATLAASHEP